MFKYGNVDVDQTRMGIISTTFDSDSVHRDRGCDFQWIKQLLNHRFPLVSQSISSKPSLACRNSTKLQNVMEHGKYLNDPTAQLIISKYNLHRRVTIMTD